MIPDDTQHCDVAIIGAGTAGIAAERTARENGAETRLIDPRFAGTTCATVGCMPSKLLISAGAAAHAASETSEFGISTTVEVDGPAVMSRLRRHRDRFVDGVQRTFRDLPAATRVTARARFVDDTTLALDTGGRVEARAVIIATGARPVIPGAFAGLGDRVLTNETLFELPDLPTSVAVIGGGPEGVELAQALARLGVAVTLFEAGRRIAGLPDPLSAKLGDILSEEMAMHLETEPEAMPEGDGVRLRWEGGACSVDRLLVAAGRPPSLDALELENAGLELDEHGTPRFDPESLQCGASPVFIAGDANHHRPVLHEASAEGTIAGRNAATFPECARGSRTVPLTVTFTRPEAAIVGHVPEAGDAGDTVTATADFENQGKAVVEGRAAGALRVHAERQTGRLVGAALCLPDGGHLAHLFALAISRDLTAGDLLAMPFYHPTLEEGIRPALRHICSECESARPWDRNDGNVPGD